MLDRQGLHVPAEGQEASEPRAFRIPFIVTVLQAVSQTPGIQAMQGILPSGNWIRAPKLQMQRRKVLAEDSCFL